MTAYLKGEKEFMGKVGDPETYQCHPSRMDPGPSPRSEFMFVPDLMGQMIPGTNMSSISFEGSCFEKIEMSLTYSGEGAEGSVVLDVNATNKRNLYCSDIFLLGNLDTHHLEAYFFAGTHRSVINLPGTNAVNDMQRSGLYTYLFCEGVVDEILSVFTTVKAYLGGFALHGHLPIWSAHVPKYMEDANKEFMRWAVNYTLEERTT